MDNKLIKATNIKWVEYWMRQAHPSCDGYEIYAREIQKDKWVCEIELPLIEKTVKSTSSDYERAIINSANKAAKLIDEYMKNHLELDIRNIFEKEHWVIAGFDESRTKNKDGIQAKAKLLLKEIGAQVRIADSIEVIKKSINKIGTINNNKKNVFIHVISKSQFSETYSPQEAMDEALANIRKSYIWLQCISTYDPVTESIIIYGYTGNPEKEEDEEGGDA